MLRPTAGNTKTGTKKYLTSRITLKSIKLPKIPQNNTQCFQNGYQNKTGGKKAGKIG